MSVCPRAEILSMEPSLAVLKLMHLNVIDNVEKFHWLEAPSMESIRLAIHRLRWLKAIDPTSDRLTEIGKRMAQLGLLPMISAMILNAVDKPCINYVLALAGMLNVSDSVWWYSKDVDAQQRGKEKRVYFSRGNQDGGDFITLLKIFFDWQSVEPEERTAWCFSNTISAKAMKIASESANEIARQLHIDLPKFSETTIDQSLINEVMSCVKAGFFQNLGIFSGSIRGGYRVASTIQGQPGILAQIYRLSSLYSVAPRPTYVLYHGVLCLNRTNCMVTLCRIPSSDIPREWLDYHSGKSINPSAVSRVIGHTLPTPVKVSASNDSDRLVVTPVEQIHLAKPKAPEKAEKYSVTSESVTRKHDMVANLAADTSVGQLLEMKTFACLDLKPESKVNINECTTSIVDSQKEEKKNLPTRIKRKPSSSKPDISVPSIKDVDDRQSEQLVNKPESNEINAKNSSETKSVTMLSADRHSIVRPKQNSPTLPDEEHRLVSKVGNERSVSKTEIFNTIDVVRKGSYRVGDKEIQLNSKQLKTILYNHRSKLHNSVTKSLSDFNTFPFPSTNVRVLNEDRLIVYKELVSQGRRPVLLNMACPTSPGGNYLLGARTQEATLFLCSNYFLSLDANLDYVEPTDRFYCDSNCELRPLSRQKPLYPIDEFGAIYTSGLTIFLQPEKNDYAFMEKPLSDVCIIAMAAYLDSQVNNEGHLVAKYSIGMRKKIENMFSIAYHHNHDCLVLSAFGCGNFQNPPSHVAEIFQSVIQQYGGFFEQIHFAIVDDYNTGKDMNPSGNYQPFKTLLDYFTVRPLRDETPDTMIGPWRIKETKQGNISLESVRIFSLPLCSNGGKCENMQDTKHCAEYLHPPLCPFSVGSNICKQKPNRNHMLWFKHHLGDRQDTRSSCNSDRWNMQTEVDKSCPQSQTNYSNRQRFHSADRLGPSNFTPPSHGYSAMLRHGDHSRIHTNPKFSVNPTTENSYQHSTIFSTQRTEDSTKNILRKDNKSNATKLTQAYRQPLDGNAFPRSTHSMIDVKFIIEFGKYSSFKESFDVFLSDSQTVDKLEKEIRKRIPNCSVVTLKFFNGSEYLTIPVPDCNRTLSSYGIRSGRSVWTEIVIYETNPIPLTQTQAERSVPRLFNGESHNIIVPQFPSPLETIPIGDRQLHRQTEDFSIGAISARTNAARPSTTSGFFRRPVD